MNNQLSIKVKERDVIFFLMAVVFCTVLRVSLLLIYPLLVLFLFYYLDWRFSRNGLVVLVFIFFCWLLSFRNGIYIKYNLVSFFYFVPFLLLIMAVPYGRAESRHLESFVKALTIVTVINNIAGIAQYIRSPYDDSFQGFYGGFTVSQNGLSLLNGILFFYYLQLFNQTKKIKHMSLCIFFIICSVMGFYGAGAVALLTSITLSYFKPTLKNILKFLVIGAALLFSVYFIIKTISPRTLDYNVNIIKAFWKGDVASGQAPRKLIIFRNYYDAYAGRPLDLLFGSGPGTFNSRSAFMVGSPTYFNLEMIKSDYKPYNFASYAYPLWNPDVIHWYDGYMNQPFTSFLAFLGEYGIITTLLVLGLIAASWRRVNRHIKTPGQPADKRVPFMYFRFLTIFMVCLIVIDNYVEYPETIALIAILIKLCETRIIGSRGPSGH